MGRRGHNRERDVKAELEAKGWVVVRAAGSLGPVDLVALKQRVVISGSGTQDVRARVPDPVVTTRSLLVEVKSTDKSPWEHFGPKERDEVRVLAARTGAQALLAYWPKCRPGQSKDEALRFLWEREWPR